MQAHPIVLPAFGALIAAQGGHFAAIMRGPIVAGVETPPYALIVSPADTELGKYEWGKYGTELTGCDDRRDGVANTQAMAAAECPAALRTREFAHAGHTDWYLPALGELNAATANVPELFDKTGWYWTSTQASRYNAFAQGFEYGCSDWSAKGHEFRVRAFRRIPLDLLTA